MSVFGNSQKTTTRPVASGESGLTFARRMGATRKFAGIPCGRWSKWGILAFWVVVVAVAGPLAGKLNNAQKNDASQWLPKNAESTKVLNQAKAFVPSDVVPALVVY
jgi:RND superfamily putative drug exporter